MYTPFPPPQQPRKVSVNWWKFYLALFIRDFSLGRSPTGIRRILPQASREKEAGRTRAQTKGMQLSLLPRPFLKEYTASRNQRKTPGRTRGGFCSPRGGGSAHRGGETETEAESNGSGDGQGRATQQRPSRREKEETGREYGFIVGCSRRRLLLYFRLSVEDMPPIGVGLVNLVPL